MADITTAALIMFAITEITGKNAQSLLNARAGFAPAPVRWLIPIINARILTFTKAAFAIEIRLKQDKRNSGNFSRCFFSSPHSLQKSPKTMLCGVSPTPPRLESKLPPPSNPHQSERPVPKYPPPSGLFRLPRAKPALRSRFRLYLQYMKNPAETRRGFIYACPNYAFLTIPASTALSITATSRHPETGTPSSSRTSMPFSRQ